jgi:hypothetical protein
MAAPRFIGEIIARPENCFASSAGFSQEHMKMPNRTELAATKRPKTAVARLDRPLDYNNESHTYDMGADGIWLVAGLCVIGALISIDFAAYFQLLDQLPMIVTQVP